MSYHIPFGLKRLLVQPEVPSEGQSNRCLYDGIMLKDLMNMWCKKPFQNELTSN